MIRSSYLAPSAVIAALSALSFHSEVQGQQATHGIHLLGDWRPIRLAPPLEPPAAWPSGYCVRRTWDPRSLLLHVGVLGSVLRT